jgi:hypothetical protein
VAAMRANPADSKLLAKIGRRRAATAEGKAHLAKARAALNAPGVNERMRAGQRAFAATAEGRAAKSRAGIAAMKSLRGASGSMKWRYNDHRFRSSWELIFARYLDGLGVRWQYELRAYKLPNGKHYVPDFHVEIPGTGTVVVEIKGQREGRWAPGVAKFFEFCKSGGVPAIILGEEEIDAAKRELAKQETITCPRESPSL